MIRLMRYMGRYRWRVGCILALLFLQILGTLYIPTLTADIVDTGIVKGDVEYVWRLGVIMLVVAAIAALVSMLETYLSTSTFSAVGRDIRGDLFKKSQQLTVDQFNQFGPSSLITRCTNDITQIQQAYMAATEMLLPAPIMAIAGLILAFSKSPRLALLIVAAMAVVCVVAAIAGTRTMRLFVRLQSMLDAMNRSIREALTGIRVIRAFNRTRYEQKRMNSTFGEYAATSIRVNRIVAALMPAAMVVMNLCTVLIVQLGGQGVADGQMGVGDIMAIIQYASLILMYLLLGIGVFLVLPRAEACARRVSEVLDVETDAALASGPADVLATEDHASPVLAFKDVVFRYAGAEEPVLKDITFSVPRGTTTAIIGGTGSGKSTIASLIPRFHDIQSGTILVNGHDITTVPEKELRDLIGFVPQKAFLFSGTILSNLRDGKESATLDDARHAADVAQASEFIDSLDKGYDAPVSQGGTNFSGGQRQRLAIARALVRHPSIYVFDDSFSALDFATDARLRAALKEETGDAAVVMVAQRVSTIMDADQIVVLDEGRIAGIGTHDELLKTCKVYQQIAASQLSEEELGEERG